MSNASGNPADADDAGVDAVRADGGIVHLRAVRPEDAPRLRDLHLGLDDRSFYLRFFGVARSVVDEYVARLIRPAGPDHRALTAWIDGRLVGVAAFERVDEHTADVAITVADAHHHQGIGTLLLEHLAAVARRDGVTRFVADVLSDNATVLALLRDSGYRIATVAGGGAEQLAIDLAVTERVTASVQGRERAADWESLHFVLSPRSVAVIGVSSRPDSMGHQVLRNIMEGGFRGRLDAVNPHRAEVLGLRCAASVLDLPAPPDLAVVTVPADQVATVVDECGRAGVRGVLLIASGFGELGPGGFRRQADVLPRARAGGVRLIGPNCLGLVNTDPGIRLNATFAAMPMRPGRLALASQSGALGVAVVESADRLGIGVAQFVSVGNKADVSTNDLLLAWQQDDRVDVIALYAESFGNPRRFARIGRQVAGHKPVLALKGGRSPAGRQAGLSHTAAAAASDDVVDALFHQAGVLRVGTTDELLDASRVLLEQPAPPGNRVLIIGNAGGPGILAADAAAGAGLRVVDLPEDVVSAIQREVPTAASCRNPVDLGSGATAEQFGAAARVAAAAPEVDAVLAVFVAITARDPDTMIAAIVEAVTAADRPLVITWIGAAPGSVQVPGIGRPVPVFSFPEPAAAAVALAARSGRIRRELSLAMPAVRPTDLDRVGATATLAEASTSRDRWLDAADTDRVLRCYGLTVARGIVARDADGAVAAATALGFPVAVKLASGGLHKSDIGGVRTDLGDPPAVRDACAAVRAAGPDGRVLVQEMIPDGVELILGGIQDPRFGPLVMVGIGGTMTSLLADRVFRLAPVTTADATAMTTELRMGAMLDGFRGARRVDRDAVADAIARIGWLVADCPVIAELDVNPMICRGDRLTVVDARIRLGEPADHPDPAVRQLD
jgi:acyl-CoA synthetase (NDP forming)/GNAT superfamily N-acetyltransferase